MAYWKKCPECGETNYYETFDSQYFDCGFQGYCDEDIREARCAAYDNSQDKLDHQQSGPVDSELAHLRLALLDAAQVADVIATDMQNANHSEEYPDRCRELAQQMRMVAGHSQDFGTKSSFNSSRPRGSQKNQLLTFVRKIKPW